MKKEVLLHLFGTTPRCLAEFLHPIIKHKQYESLLKDTRYKTNYCSIILFPYRSIAFFLPQ